MSCDGIDHAAFSGVEKNDDAGHVVDRAAMHVEVEIEFIQDFLRRLVFSHVPVYLRIYQGCSELLHAWGTCEIAQKNSVLAFARFEDSNNIVAAIGFDERPGLYDYMRVGNFHAIPVDCRRLGRFTLKFRQMVESVSGKN